MYQKHTLPYNYFHALLLGLSFMFMHLSEAKAQISCGTELKEEEARAAMVGISGYYKQPDIRQSNVITIFPIRAYVFRRSDGTGGNNVNSIINMISYANIFFQKINIKLQLIGEVIYVDDDNLFDLEINPYEEELIKRLYYDPKAINVYYANLIGSANSILCGKSTFPYREKSFFPTYMNHSRNSCSMNEVFAHELGHLFGLLHTHETASGVEPVSRATAICDSTGDFLCDTEADPNLSRYGNYIYNCRWLGNITDTNGDRYRPDPANIMSYAPHKCLLKFTTGQYDLMNYVSKEYVSKRYTSFNSNAPYLYFNTPVLTFTSEKSFKNIYIYANSNLSWRLSSNVPWLSLSGSFGAGSMGIQVNCEANPDSEPRKAIITANAGGLVRTIEVIQEKGSVTIAEKSQVALVIDITGSMNEEIYAVKRALNRVLATYDPNKRTVFQVATFRDDSQIYPSSTDISSIKSIIDNLVASAGGDCPEPSLKTLFDMIDQLADNGTVFMVTDAAPWGGSPLKEIINHFKSKGIKFHAVISGDCPSKLQGCPHSANSNSALELEEVESYSLQDSNKQINNSIFPYNSKDFDVSGYEAFTYLTKETGGAFAYLRDVNCNDPSAITRYENTIYNILQGGITYSLLTANPSEGAQGSTLKISIKGSNTNFSSLSSFSQISGTGIFINDQKIVSPNEIILSLTISPFASLGFRDIVVKTTQLNGKIEEARGVGVLEVIPGYIGASISSITPAFANQGERKIVEIYGYNSNFISGRSQLDLGSGIIINTLSVINANYITADITVSPYAEVGTRDVKVTTGTQVALGKSLFWVEFSGNTNPYININPKENFQVDNQKTTIELDIQTNLSWKINSNDIWLRSSVESGKRDAKILITVDANVSSIGRTGTLTISGSGIEKTIIIEQSNPVSSCVLPAGWMSKDIGGTFFAGKACYDGIKYTLQATGDDIYGNNDQFHFAYQILKGNFQVTARVLSIEGYDPYSKGGVMIRETLEPNSKHASTIITREKGSEFLFREFTGGTTDQVIKQDISAPYWIRVIRNGNNFEGYQSRDGINWTLLGVKQIIMSNQLYVGLAMTGHDRYILGKGLFDKVSISASTPTPLPPSNCTLPVGWQSSDVGGPSKTGSACYNSGIYTVKASGSDIYLDSDQFHFAYQAWNGDVQISARVRQLTGTNPYTKGGVMIRENLTGNSKHANVNITREKGLEFIWRRLIGANTEQELRNGSIPYWVRLVRRGNTFEGYVSSNGNSWELVGTQSISMSSNTYVGLDFTSHDDGYLGEAIFDQVVIEKPVSLPGGCDPNSRTTFANGGYPWTLTNAGILRIEAENYDQGCFNDAFYDTDPANTGGAYRSDAVDIEPCFDVGGGFNIGYIASGEWLEYTVFVDNAGLYDLRARAASGRNESSLINFTFKPAAGGAKISTGNLVLNSTGGWQNWVSIPTRNVYLGRGWYEFRVDFVDAPMNYNWVELGPAGSFAIPTEALTFSSNIPDLSHLRLYPNPAQKQATLEFYAEYQGNATLHVIDIIGRKVIKKLLTLDKGFNTHKIELGDLAKGVYLVELRSASREILRLIVE